MGNNASSMDLEGLSDRHTATLGGRPTLDVGPGGDKASLLKHANTPIIDRGELDLTLIGSDPVSRDTKPSPLDCIMTPASAMPTGKIPGISKKTSEILTIGIKPVGTTPAGKMLADTEPVCTTAAEKISVGTELVCTVPAGKISVEEMRAGAALLITNPTETRSTDAMPACMNPNDARLCYTTLSEMTLTNKALVHSISVSTDTAVSDNASKPASKVLTNYASTLACTISAEVSSATIADCSDLECPLRPDGDERSSASASIRPIPVPNTPGKKEPSRSREESDILMQKTEVFSRLGSAEEGEAGGGEGEEGRSEGSEEDRYPGGLLRQAAIFNNVELMKSLLKGKERRYVDARDSLGRTPLFTCVTNDSFECAQLLLCNGADANIANELRCGGKSALHVAAEQNKARFVLLLVQHGADAERMDAGGRQALELALRRGCTGCTDILQQAIAGARALKEKFTRGFLSACLSGDLTAAKRNAEAGRFKKDELRTMINSSQRDCASLLHHACDSGNEELCRYLLKEGARVIVSPRSGLSPLHIACIAGHTGCVDAILLHAPKQLRVASRHGSLPLHLACSRGHHSVVFQLLTAISWRPYNGPPLCAIPAARSSSDASSEGTDPRLWDTSLLNAKDALGRTALHCAVAYNHCHVIELLLSVRLAGLCLSSDGSADPDRHMEGLTLFFNSGRSLDATRSEGVRCEVNSLDGGGFTALHLAVIGDGLISFHRAVTLLLQHGADPRLSDRPGGQGSLLLGLAAERGDFVLVDALMRYGARDEGGRVMEAAILSGDGTTIGLLVKYRANVDTEHRINHASLRLEQDLAREVKPEPSSFHIQPIRPSPASTNQIPVNHAPPSQAPYTLLGLSPSKQAFTSGSSPSALKLTRFREPSGTVCPALQLDWQGLGLYRLRLAWLLAACRHQLGLETRQELGEEAKRGTNDAPKIELRSCDGAQDTVPGGLAGKGGKHEGVNEGRGVGLSFEWGLGGVLSLHALTKIDLSNNELKMVPGYLLQLPSLRTLNLSHNLIKGIEGCTTNIFHSDLSTIDKPNAPSSRRPLGSPNPPGHPGLLVEEDWVLNCVCLEEIDLEYNLLPILHPVILRLPALKDLNVSHNRIVRLPFELWSCPALEWLNLSHNRITGVDPCLNASVGREQSCYSGQDQVCSAGQSPAGRSGKDQACHKAWGPLLGCVSCSQDTRPACKSDEEGGAQIHVSSSLVDPSLIVQTNNTPSESSAAVQRGCLSFSQQGYPCHSERLQTLDENSTDGVSIGETPAYTECTLHVGRWRENICLPSVCTDILFEGRSRLRELNLSHNRLRGVPRGLSCLAPALETLLLAHNALEDLGPIHDFPRGLKSLDVSHNRLRGVLNGALGGRTGEAEAAGEGENFIGGNMRMRKSKDGGLCYCPPTPTRSSSAPRLSSSPRTPSISTSQSQILLASSAPSRCSHRTHQRLDKLLYLLLNHNSISQILLLPGAKPGARARTQSEVKLEGQLGGQPGALFRTQPGIQVGAQPGTQPRAEIEVQVENQLGGQPGTRSGARLAPSDEATAVPDTAKKKGYLVEREGVDSAWQELLYPALTRLDLGDNEVTAVPRDIARQRYLGELNVSNNPINELPVELGEMKSLWSLQLTGCPAYNVMQSLLGEKVRSTASIRGYLKSIQDEETPFNVLKLMFIGNQGLGKTSLLKMMQDGSQKYTHWTRRMFPHTADAGGPRGENLSTVGVDIDDLVIRRNKKQLVFRSWDFGGQKEYYATHQYFLSRRALYLVVWRLTDGERGVNDLLRWLINIQARAPDSPVIIVGTHRDLIDRSYSPSYVHDLGALVMRKYGAVGGWAPHRSLPRVLGHVELSCVRRGGGEEVTRVIWDVMHAEKLPKSDMLLLDLKVPSIYLKLQTVVAKISAERRREGRDPVLYEREYKRLVMDRLEDEYQTSFSSAAELNLATQFLHENGILLHYDDVSLRALYFLDPQWLSDMLASVISIREINSVVRAGLMRVGDLALLFKGMSFRADGADSICDYMVRLLQKFEVAVLWNLDCLLLPSLLPAERGSPEGGVTGTEIIIPVKGLSQSPPPHIALPRPPVVIHSNVLPSPSRDASFYIGDDADFTPAQLDQLVLDLELSLAASRQSDPSRESHSVGHVGENLLSEAYRVTRDRAEEAGSCAITALSNPAVSIIRLYVTTYFPCGFWPRLVTRLLDDSAFATFVTSLYDLLSVSDLDGGTNGVDDKELTEGVEVRFGMGSTVWCCWQTGVELLLFGRIPVLRLAESSDSSSRALLSHYESCELSLDAQDGMLSWAPINLAGKSVLEVLVPNEALEVGGRRDAEGERRVVVVYPRGEVVAALLARAVETVDTLLEDWYPDIGHRFELTSRGELEVLRLVACPRCLLDRGECGGSRNDHGGSGGDRGGSVYENGGSESDKGQSGSLCSSFGFFEQNESEKRGMETSGALLYHDSYRPPRSKRIPQTAVELGQIGVVASSLDEKNDFRSKGTDGDSAASWRSAACRRVFCYTVERCLQAALLRRVVYCPRHGNLGPFFVASNDGLVHVAHVAPDSVFLDVGRERFIDEDSVIRGEFLGKGAFGQVYSGVWHNKWSGERVLIALKLLQRPVKRPANDPRVPHEGAVHRGASRVLTTRHRWRWDTEELRLNCSAYLNARKELSILLNLSHPHIVPLLGLCMTPLALVLALAPHGSLGACLQNYQRQGASLACDTVKDIIVQVASALEYLHARQIIYRDLKSENVLVWSLPLPAPPDARPTGPSALPTRSLVDVRLADYGVSRLALPGGTRGMAGTPAFMAPEILRHNGAETYTDKVDCYSFGLFLYELVSLKAPYEKSRTRGGRTVRPDSHVTAGHRPTITNRELQYPEGIHELMTACWSPDPDQRPTANQIIEFASRPEFTKLHSVVQLEEGLDVDAACCVQHLSQLTDDDLVCVPARTDVWIASSRPQANQSELYIYSYDDPFHKCSSSKLLTDKAPGLVVSMCVTPTAVWCATNSSTLLSYGLADYRLKQRLNIQSCAEASVISLLYCPAEDCVCVVMDSGALVVCPSSSPTPATSRGWGRAFPLEGQQGGGEGGRVHCAVVVTVAGHSEVWCGQSHGSISVWSAHRGAYRSTLTLGHVAADCNCATVKLASSSTHPDLCAMPFDPCSASCGSQSTVPYVWVYTEPGSIIYRWNAATKKISGTIDLLKNLPQCVTPTATPSCRGASLPRGSLCGQLDCGVAQLSDIHHHLYVAMSCGALAVYHRRTLTPLAVCQPYTQSTTGAPTPLISAILPFTHPAQSEPAQLGNTPMNKGQSSAANTGQSSAANAGQSSAANAGQSSAANAGQSSAANAGQSSAANAGQSSAKDALSAEKDISTKRETLNREPSHRGVYFALGDIEEAKGDLSHKEDEGAQAREGSSAQKDALSTLGDGRESSRPWRGSFVTVGHSYNDLWKVLRQRQPGGGEREGWGGGQQSCLITWS